MRIVCISDTHSLHDRITVPDGDILIHAGDCSKRGREIELVNFNDWLGSLPHRHKILIAGNHDFLFEEDPSAATKLITNATYLLDSGVEIEGLHIWGSPWQPWFFDWAFNLKRGEPLREKWALIPANTDVLVTHGPPYGYLDHTVSGKQVGCEELVKRLPELNVKLHVFGHIHEAYGQARLGNTVLCNASVCDISYRPVNQPWVVEL